VFPEAKPVLATSGSDEQGLTMLIVTVPLLSTAPPGCVESILKVTTCSVAVEAKSTREHGYVHPTGKRAALGDKDPSILMSVRLFEETPH